MVKYNNYLFVRLNRLSYGDSNCSLNKVKRNISYFVIVPE